jgi:hypothetical protein
MDGNLRTLIEDAKLVALYGQRSGMLSGAALPLALQNITALPDPDWSHAEASQLQAALATALAEIRPVTLINLRSGWDPFVPRAPSIWDYAKKVLFLAAALILIFYCASLTIWQQRAQALLTEIEAGLHLREAELIRDIAFRLSIADDFDRATDLTSQTSLSRAALREQVEELRTVSNRLRGQRDEFQALFRSAYPGEGLLRALMRRLQDAPPPLPAMDSVPAGPSGIIATAALASAETVNAQAMALAATPPSQLEVCLRRYEGQVATVNLKAEDPSAPLAPVDLLGRSIMLDSALMEHVQCVLGMRQDQGIPLAVASYYVQAQQEKLQNRLALLGSWTLPALFGMLGAMLYYLRILLNPLFPEPNLMRVPLRVALGGLAGISVAWLWSPTVVQGLGVPDVSLGLLTIAFLLGYAIDVFFALIDRLVAIARTWVGRLGAAT